MRSRREKRPPNMTHCNMMCRRIFSAHDGIPMDDAGDDGDGPPAAPAAALNVAMNGGGGGGLPVVGAAAEQLLAVVDGHHGNANGHEPQPQPAAAAAAAANDNHHNNNDGPDNNPQNNHPLTAEEAAAAAIASAMTAYDSAPDPPQTASEVRLSALRDRHYRNRQTLVAVLDHLNEGRWEALRYILKESEAEDRNQIFAVDNMMQYVGPLPFTVEMNVRRSDAAGAATGSDGGGGNDNDGVDDGEPNAMVLSAAHTASRAHSLDANVFQACCLSGRDVPVDILHQIVEIGDGCKGGSKRALTTATKPPARYHHASAHLRSSRYMYETVRREPIDIVCVHGHANVLQFILGEVGGGEGKAATPQQRSKVRALAGGEDPGFDISLLDACFVRQLMPHAFTGMGTGPPAAHIPDGITSTTTNEFIRYHLEDVLTTLRGVNTEKDMNAPLANTWSKAKMIMEALFCNPARGRPFPSLVLHKLFSREYGSNILSLIPWLVLKLYPDQARAADSNGNLPLHCFCQHDAGRKLYQFEMIPGTENLLTAEARAMLDMIGPGNILSTIISCYPGAALAKNRRGRLPLHEASDNKWFDFEDIERLAKADPEALDVPDPISGLYPFMMAASHPPVHKTGYDDITKIFILLRESPENARRCLERIDGGGGKTESRKVAKKNGSTAKVQYRVVNTPGKRKSSGRGKKRIVDDDFLSGSSSEDEDDRGIGDGSYDFSSTKKSAARTTKSGPRPSARARSKSPSFSQKRLAPKSGYKDKKDGKKYTSLSWNNDSDDSLMDDRDELF